MRKLLICDKDGTLTLPKSGGKWVKHPEDQVLIPGVLDKFKEYRAAGWDFAIATNQGGVAKGKKTLEDALNETIFAMHLLGISHKDPVAAMVAHSYEELQNEAYLCWLSFGGYQKILITGGDYPFRKPGAGMIRQLAKMGAKEQVYDQILFVGDRPEDVLAAGAAGVPFLLAMNWIETSCDAAANNIF
jgi:D-glycero-D-manno-heptose 1,7-bisphosphate phosphatase